MVATPTEVASVLADPTRFQIYQRLLHERPRSYTAQEVARRFYLHPNVARTHLGRLEEVGLVEAFSEKSGRGGRPARRYRATDRAVTLQFPRRDWLWLSRLLVRTLERLGPEALRVARREAYEEGLAQGRQVASQAAGAAGDPTPGGAGGACAGQRTGGPMAWVEQALVQQSGVRGLTELPGGRLNVRFTTCVLREVAQDHPQTVCSLHQAYLHGLIEGLLGPVDLQPARPDNLLAGQPGCDWIVERVGRRVASPAPADGAL